MLICVWHCKNVKEVDFMEQIPVWQKYVITPEEASSLFALPAEFFRLAGHLTKEGIYDLPCFWIGSHLKINRMKMIEWLNSKSDGREDFKTSLLKKRVEELKNGLNKRGRKRKIR